MSVIKLEKLTKDYGRGRGIFDLNLTIEQGEMMGYVGTNGSGKTTTIRNMLGFLKPTRGAAYVNGLSSWEHASEIAAKIGYVPGEIAFPDLKTGVDFLKCQAGFLGLKNMNYADELIAKLQLDPRANLKRMSKGMKQKTALVAALMNDSPIIVLDEPTTGLDPLMRATFLDIIKEEHKKGKTIFMSSHSFEELESTCDRVALINDGRIIDVCCISEIKNRPEKEFKIEFNSRQDYLRFIGGAYKIVRMQEQYNQATVKIPAGDTAALLRALRPFDVKFISELSYSLERHFKNVLIAKKEKEKNENEN